MPQIEISDPVELTSSFLAEEVASLRIAPIAGADTGAAEEGDEVPATGPDGAPLKTFTRPKKPGKRSTN